MIAQALHLLYFCADVLLEGEISRHHVAAKHEVLPDHEAELVADVVEVVATRKGRRPIRGPYSCARRAPLKNLPIARRRDAAGKAVEGNHIGAFGEDRNPVHDKGEALAPLVGLAAQFSERSPVFTCAAR